KAALVIGSDQVATYDGLQIGKPGTHEKALAQLQAMRGREVLFHSALCVFDSRSRNAQRIDVVTRVRFRELPKPPYTAEAGARAGGPGITRIEAIKSDDPPALIGLPLIALSGMLLAAGYP